MKLSQKLLAVPLAATFVAGALFTTSRAALPTAGGFARLSPMGGGVAPVDTGIVKGEDSVPEIGAPVKPVSMDIDVRKIPQVGIPDKLKKPARELVFPGMETYAVDAAVTDEAVQMEFGTLAMPAPNGSFAGLDLQDWGGGWPPDTHGAVGPNHFIQAVNSSMAIYDKATGTRLAAFTLDNFFPAGNACDTNNNGDPIVL
jgi:hypothetical protein